MSISRTHFLYHSKCDFCTVGKCNIAKNTVHFEGGRVAENEEEVESKRVSGASGPLQYFSNADKVWV
eukprot:1449883-Rhodomonas_salina.2